MPFSKPLLILNTLGRSIIMDNKFPMLGIYTANGQSGIQDEEIAVPYID